MSDTIAPNQLPPSRPRRRIPWAFLSQLLLVASLIASNVATVVSDRVHQVAFDLFERVASVAGDAVADRLLSNSPTRLRRAEVERVARPLRAERDAIRVQRDLAVSRHRKLQLEQEAARVTAAKRAAAVRTVARNATAKIAMRSADTLTTFPARAAPYVGVAALIGFTGYELKMDCELAQSLANLNSEHDNEPIDVGPICRRVNEVPTFEQAWEALKAKADVSQRLMYEALQTHFPRLQKAADPPQAPASGAPAKPTSSATP